ncbi:chromosomal replication initiator protein DnaA [Nigerium massiliense]|uniref:chromosomal replication initiator protein DnaA n=1 Tax=Nigerium massiliense TaxID=1522317 RepID=UPI0009079BA0|nr:chromosomal replication initiator protein DnaA [Nigerium massiliense]
MPNEVDSTLAASWDKVMRSAEPSARAWLSAVQVEALLDSTLVAAVAHEFTRERIETRLRSWIEEQLSDIYKKPIRLAVTINPDLDLDIDEDAVEGNQADASETLPMAVPSYGLGSVPRPSSTQSGGDRLNPKYTFDNFVIGSSNRFAHAAAVAVAESPGKAYNPLMIYGESGLGKTHLLHALGHYVRQYYDGVRVKYVSTEELTNDFINAISDNRTAEFRRNYRDIDVLLIDDIQFLESKIQTQEEFFHTFNTLHNAQKQIVLTCDRPPKALEALEPRLRSRFEWGLITDIQPPDLETRIAILRKKAIAEHLTVAPEVLEFIGSKIQTNIRELEGALIRVTAFASLNGQPVDLALTETVLKDLIPDGGDAPINPQAIMSQTANYFGVSLEDLCGTSRTHVLVTARQIAMYLCRELTDLSLPKIGQLFGGRDHTTVMHADRKIRQLLSERRSVYNQVTELTNRIKNSPTR